MIRPFTRFPAFALFALGVVPLTQAQFGDPVQVNGRSIRGEITLAGDIDADGDEDVLIGDDRGTVAYWLNSGAGSFVSPRYIDALDTVHDLSLADLDGDSDLDLIVVGSVNGTNVKLMWYEFLGTGEYGPRVTIQNNVDGYNATAADLDGDGDLDVLTYDRSAFEVIYFENLGGGTISMDSTRIGMDASVISVAAADLDGDGDMDVVTGINQPSPFGFYIYENQGGGNWTRTFAPNVVFWGRYAAFEFGDLDGDGDLDIVAASPGADRFDWYDQVTPMVFRNRQQFLQSSDGASSDIGDIDADGDLDILMYGSDVDWQENLGGGAFATHRIETTPVNSGTARLADLDGSGTLDILYSYRAQANGTLWKSNLGGGMFGDSQSLSVIELDSASAVAAADFDGDGDLDVTAMSRTERVVVVWENLGQDTFTRGVTVSGAYDLQINGVELLTTDVDGDGDPDVVVAAGGVYWYENQGLFSGQFEPQQALWAGPFLTDTIRAADINGDGLMDIVGNAQLGFTQETYVLYGIQGGPDGSPPEVMGTVPSKAISLATADFDGDGDVDVAFRMNTFFGVWWIENLAGGAFAPADRMAGGTGVSSVVALEAADLDQDGNVDIISAGEFELEWSRGLGDGTFEAGGTSLDLLVTHQRFRALEIADVNGDSRPDVIASTLSYSVTPPDSISWIENLGDEGFGPGASFDLDMLNVTDLFAVDFDGDLDVDFLVTAFDDHRIIAFKNVDGVGAGFCAPAALNSENKRASITGSGSTLIADDDLTLTAFDLPLHKAGYFLVSRTQGFVAQPAGSQGNLCLGGSIGRYVQQVGSSGSTGTLPLVVRASAITQPQGDVSAVSGETWSFQCWFRDQVAGTNTSNFSSGFAVLFR